MNLERPTEQRNTSTIDIDVSPTEDIVSRILTEDVAAVNAALAAAPTIAVVAERTHERMRAGGRLHYFGAGASGRLAVLDATELTPTFGLPRGMAVAHFPGGSAALVDSTIDLEDGRELGSDDATQVEAGDVVIAVTASGTTQYVAGALSVARDKGAYTALITCNALSPLAEYAADVIVLETGAEAITGSTRLKAGTATKVTLNALSTAIMVRLGLTYSNLMIGMSVTNEKLRERAVALIAEGTGASADESRAALDAADQNIPRAFVALLGGVDSAAASAALSEHRTARAAIAAIKRGAQ